MILPLIIMSLTPQAQSKAQSSIIAPSATLQKLSGDFSFAEGGAVDKEGNVYFTDQPNDRIMKWTVDGRFEEWMKPCGRSNGIRFDHKGHIIACADENNELWSISLDKSHAVLLKDYQGKLMNGPNDIWVRPDGGIYITDPLYARPYWKRDPAMQQPGMYVFYLTPDRKTLTPVATDLVTPNGIIGSPDGKTLYVGDLGANKTFEYKIQKDGSLADKKFFCELGSDGMTRDEDGNIYLSGHGVTVYDKNGGLIEHIPVPEDWVGNLTFGGKDHKMLFICASKGAYGLQMRVRGSF